MFTLKKKLNRHTIIKDKKVLDAPIFGSRQTRWFMEISYNGEHYEFFVRPSFVYAFNNGYSPDSPRFIHTLEVYIDIVDYIRPTDYEGIQYICQQYSEGLTHREMPRKFDVKFMELDPTGVTVSQKRCFGCLINEISFGDLGDVSNGNLNMKMDIRCDYYEDTIS
jgi:hypothetical protein